MATILIVSYYELKESLASAAAELKKVGGYDICNYPLYQYYQDVNDRKPDCLEHAINFFAQSDAKIVLFWYFGVPQFWIHALKQTLPKAYWIIYSWDDPFTFYNDSQHIDKCKYFDLAITSCEDSIQNYLKYGCKDAIWQPPGFDPAIHYPLNFGENYLCDISLCCTSLYDNLNVYPNQKVPRRQIVDYLVKNFTPNQFHLYGPENFSKLYPLHYKGYLNYNETSVVFNKSRINITTHVVGKDSGYLNERSILIAACGGLLVTDLSDIFINGKHCVSYSSLEEFEKVIKKILLDYNAFKAIKNNSLFYAFKKFTWKAWAKKIHIKINSFFFNSTNYKQINELHFLDDSLSWKHWLLIGRKNGLLTFAQKTKILIESTAQCEVILNEIFTTRNWNIFEKLTLTSYNPLTAKLLLNY